MSNEAIFGYSIFGLLAAFAVFFIVLFLMYAIVYIFGAIGLFKIAKRSPKADLAWLAWIPVANTFLMALLVEEDVHEGLRGKYTLIYGIAVAAVIIIGSFIPFSGIIVPAFIYYSFYFIASRFSSNAILHVIIGVITGGISVAISLFMFRNRSVINQQVVDSE